MTFTDVKISVPKEMEPYVISTDQRTVLERNALLLYPYIKKMVISHGKAAEILGICKNDLIEIFDEMGLPYLNFTMNEIEEEVAAFKRLKGEKV
ncbi:MAG: UPF0175 family protein [Clostridiales bacterium]|nr:UPF0175 family protein [Clostridiales bacterium]